MRNGWRPSDDYAQFGYEVFYALRGKVALYLVLHERASVVLDLMDRVRHLPGDYRHISIRT